MLDKRKWILPLLLSTFAFLEFLPENTSMNWKSKSKNVVSWYNKREYSHENTKKFQQALQVNLPFAQRLRLEQELEGHTGCVNCLDWNESGDLLASGSDDLNVIVWDIKRKKPLVTLLSGHEGNIFSVKFLPCTNSHSIVSAAADSTIRVHCTNTLMCTRSFTCHTRRVKRLSVSSQSPHLIWSGSEDGTVRQFDLREPHSCSSVKPCANVIINLTENIGPASEVKCIEVHSIYPELLAVGGSDPFVRLYDRRIIKSRTKNGTSQSDSPPTAGCVAYFAPGHLPPRSGRGVPTKLRNYVTTHVTFSPNGQELLQNLGGEHIYSYNIKKQRKPLVFVVNSSHDCSMTKRNGLSVSTTPNEMCKKIPIKTLVESGLNSTFAQRRDKDKCLEHLQPETSCNNELPETALQYKLKGNEAFDAYNYFLAITCYSKALSLVPNSSILHANRAAALLKRCWDGDLYAALRDCQRAVELDGTHSKAYYRQARCLYELKWFEEAYICLQLFKERFPEQCDGFSIKKLEQDILLVNQKSKGSEEELENKSGGETPRVRRRVPYSTSNEEERSLRESAFDYEKRFVGACNTTTDIKEANYFGSEGKFIVAGSDCGCMLLWETSTTKLIEAWQGDESIVNCLQPHPSTCLIATSGIDPVVRLWSPRSTETNINSRAKEVEGLVRSNQKRMNTDPLEEMLRTMGYRPNMVDLTSDDDDDDTTAMQCHTS